MIDASNFCHELLEVQKYRYRCGQTSLMSSLASQAHQECEKVSLMNEQTKVEESQQMNKGPIYANQKHLEINEK